MGSLLLFILLFAIFLIFGVLSIARKLLGGIFNILKGGSTNFRDSSSYSTSGDSSKEESYENSAGKSAQRMKKFKSWAEETEYEDAKLEEVEIDEKMYERMKDK